jgi:hypothetical protein
MADGIRVEVVPDDDAEADPRIPKDVLEALGPDAVLSSFHMMYIRASNWERIKHSFPPRQLDRLPPSEWSPYAAAQEAE